MIVLQPANIMIGDGGREVKLIDWGLGCVIGDDHCPADMASVGGTEGYTSPEREDEGAWECRPADMFSIGCIIYFTLTGAVLPCSVPTALYLVTHMPIFTLS